MWVQWGWENDPRIVQAIKWQNPDLNSAPYETLLTACFSLLSRCRVWGHGQKGSQARFVDQHGSCRLWLLPLQQQVLGPQRLWCCQGGPSSGHGRFFSLQEGQRSRGAACSCSCIQPMDSPVTHMRRCTCTVTCVKKLSLHSCIVVEVPPPTPLCSQPLPSWS